MRHLTHVPSIFVAFTMASVATPLDAESIVEFSMDEAPLAGMSVGTCEYGPTDVEKPFDVRLSEEGLSTIETKPGEFGNLVEHFTLAGHRGQFVSWFGIVRHIYRTGWPNRGRLLLQNTYFSGSPTVILRQSRSMVEAILRPKFHPCRTTSSHWSWFAFMASSAERMKDGR
jgi:hypothetical protein